MLRHPSPTFSEACHSVKDLDPSVYLFVQSQVFNMSWAGNTSRTGFGQPQLNVVSPSALRITSECPSGAPSVTAVGLHSQQALMEQRRGSQRASGLDQASSHYLMGPKRKYFTQGGQEYDIHPGKGTATSSRQHPSPLNCVFMLAVLPLMNRHF